MKVRDLFKKAQQYNEVAQMIGKENLIVRLEIDGRSYKDFNSYIEFKIWLEEEIVEDLAKQIIEDNSYENGKKVEYERGYAQLEKTWITTYQFWLV